MAGNVPRNKSVFLSPPNPPTMIRTLHFFAVLLCCARLFGFGLTPQVHHATCGSPTGSIQVWPNGGTWPFTYLWNTGATTSSITDVPPGIYNVTVTDAEGEIATLDVEVISTTALFLPVDPFDLWPCSDDCSAGLYQYAFPLGGMAPYSVAFDPPGPTGDGSSGYLSLTNMCAGTTYSVTVTDMNGCTGTYGPVTVTEPVVPVILSSTVTASCPDGSTGSLTVEYDQLDSIYIMGPGGWYQPVTNPFTLTNLPPGEYVLSAAVIQGTLPPYTYGNSCYHADTLEVPVTTEPCGTVDGVVYADVDGDCDQGGGEPGLPYRVLTVEPGGHLMLTDPTGAFSSSYFYGDYALDAPIDGYESLCTSLPANFTLDAGTPSASYALGLSPTFGPDVSVYLHMTGHVPGFGADYVITVQNMGPYSFSDLTVDLDYDLLLSYNSADLTPSLVEPGHLRWTIATLGGFSSQNINAELSVPGDPGLLGTVVVGTATVTPSEPDAHPSNDSWTAQRTISTSFDPNDKQALTSSRSSSSIYYLGMDNWIDYTIRFQNTGTSTAFNISITDSISPLLDMTSFSLQAASHAFQATLLPGRALRFYFPYIMLPDSGTDMAGSQGFISFRLRPVGSVTPGTVLSNAADIYFDFNEAVHTNDAVLTVEETTGLSPLENTTLHLHPNPATDALWLDLPSGIQRIDLFAADGRLVLSGYINAANVPINVRELPAGVFNVRATDGSGVVRHARFMKR
jgi:uncharacterized repeat protein (TIGR01451 family)